MIGQTQRPEPARPLGKVNLPVGILALTLLAATASACSRDTRHEILTFFFTGVPPLEEGDAAEPGAAEEAGLSPRELATRRRAKLLAQRQADLQSTLKWTHGPYGAGECESCHSFGGSLAFRSSAQTTAASLGAPVTATGRLLMPAEELCFTCHTTKTEEAANALGLRLHGPVASGFCIGCHSPHQSPRRFMLLGKDNSDLCSQCHNIAGVRQRSPIHEINAEEGCLTCHNPHMGRSAMILRSEYDELALH